MPTDLQLPQSSYWVIPGSFMAGAHPGFEGERRTWVTLRALLSHGIASFIDLTEAEECVDYEPLLAAEPRPTARPLAYWRAPIPDMSVPSTARMGEVLDRIDAARSEGHGVYLHCLGGLGRTGTVVGCYLVRGGLSGEAALERIDELRGPRASAFSLSPVTDEQRRYVMAWRAGR